MPQMDGITFIKTLRGKDLPTSAVAVLVTSTEAKDRDILGARMAGANYYLTKPISQETLIEHVVLLCGAA
jgi:two-component system chemotaxis response regulator CheY